MKEEQLKKDLKKMNPACVLANHLFGKNHTIRHKMVSGTILMVLGVIIAKSASHSIPGLHYFTDMVGYALHGMGGIPYGEYLASIPAASTLNNLNED